MQSRMRQFCAQRKERFSGEVTLVRHVRPTNRNFYYSPPLSLIYFRSSERTADGISAELPRTRVIKRSLPIRETESETVAGRLARAFKHDRLCNFPERAPATKYSLTSGFSLVTSRPVDLKQYPLYRSTLFPRFRSRYPAVILQISSLEMHSAKRISRNAFTL